MGRSPLPVCLQPCRPVRSNSAAPWTISPKPFDAIAAACLHPLFYFSKSKGLNTLTIELRIRTARSYHSLRLTASGQGHPHLPRAKKRPEPGLASIMPRIFVLPRSSAGPLLQRAFGSAACGAILLVEPAPLVQSATVKWGSIRPACVSFALLRVNFSHSRGTAIIEAAHGFPDPTVLFQHKIIHFDGAPQIPLGNMTAD